jgi:cell division protein DivIC
MRGGEMIRRKGTGTGIIVFVVLCFFGIVAFGKIKLEDRKKDLEAKIKTLELQTKEEQERAIDIKNLEAYVQTRKYIEQIAREKLGLVYDYEIIFKENDEE